MHTCVGSLATGDLAMKPDEIVVIDDNRQCIDAVVNALTGDGYRVRSALSGQDAMDLLSNTSPGLVILNIHMPDINGMRLLADFRRRDAITPVLVMSDEDRASVHEQAMVNGANGFLRKPFPPDVLLSAIHRFCPNAAMCLT
jgi:DNA-binding response OmpR family regulator